MFKRIIFSDRLLDFYHLFERCLSRKLLSMSDLPPKADVKPQRPKRLLCANYGHSPFHSNN